MKLVKVGRLRRVAATAIVATAMAGTAAVPTPAVAKTCSAGYKHAVVNGAHKCLRKGQFCAKGSDSQYHRHGFHCHRSGRLTR